MPKRTVEPNIDDVVDPVEQGRGRRIAGARYVQKYQTPATFFLWCLTPVSLFKWGALGMDMLAVCMIWPYIGWHESEFWIGYKITFGIAWLLFAATLFTLVIWFVGVHRQSSVWSETGWKWLELVINVLCGLTSGGTTIYGVVRMCHDWKWLCRFPSEHDYCHLRIRFAAMTCAFFVATILYGLIALFVLLCGIEYERDNERDTRR